MVKFNSDVVFIDTSGQIRARFGGLTLRGDDTGTADIIVGSGESLRPEADCRGPLPINLGRDFLRWNTLFACSGNFLERPTVNGSGVILQGETILPVDARTASGSIDPDTNDAYNLGAPTSRWARVNAASGVFSDDLIVDGDVNFTGTNATERPKFNGSGIALRNEELFYERTQVLDFGTTVTFGSLGQDNLQTFPHALPFPERVKLHPRYSVQNQHLNIAPGGQPSGWYLTLKKRRPDQSRVDVGSGIFFWAAADATNQVSVGSLDINAAEQEFDEGDGVEIWAHNDGSGTIINTILIRCIIGFTRNPLSSGVEI